MIAKDRYLRKICKEYERVENYEEAAADETQMWIMHHRRGIDEGKSVKELDDEGNYTNVPPEDLIFLTLTEHCRIHNEGEKNYYYGRTGEKNPFYGKTHTEEIRKKLSEAAKLRVGENHPHFGWHWYNNGIAEIKAKECPEGFVRGRLKPTK